MRRLLAVFLVATAAIILSPAVPAAALSSTDLIGGLQMTTMGSSPKTCTTGFLATDSGGYRYVITAGHCIKGGANTWYLGTRLIGTQAGYSYPTDDYGILRLTQIQPPPLSPHGLVYIGPPYANSAVTTFRAATPKVGDVVCRTGAVSLTDCGHVTAVDITEPNSAASDRLYHAIETDICGEHGDSGAPLIGAASELRNVGYGIMHSGNGFPCGDPMARSYYQPLLPVLARFNLQMLTLL